MQDTDLMRPDEDWRELGDPSERRKIQNRIAQRAYRRNMRERANKIEELKKQLKTYEELGLHITQDEDSTFQQNNNPSILSSHKRSAGGWCPPQQTTPPVATHKESYHVSFPTDPQYNHLQQQVCPAPIEQQPANSPRPPTRQRMESWPPYNSQRTVIEPLTPAPSLPMDGGMHTNSMLPLNSAEFSATTYDDITFDMTQLANKSRHSTSLLHMAVAGNHADTIRVLLQDERVMIDDQDSDGFTPLQRAVMHGRSEIVKLLLEHSSDMGLVRGSDLPLGAVGGFGTTFSGS